MSDIHQFFRYSISGYFFLVVLLSFLFFLNINIFSGVIESGSAIIIAVSGYPIGFIFYQIHSFWYWKKEDGMRKWLFEILDVNENDENFHIYRASHDSYLFQDKFKELSERIIFVSSALYMYGSLMASVFVFYIFIVFLAIAYRFFSYISIPTLHPFESTMIVIISILSGLSLWWFGEERKRHRKLLIKLEEIFVNKKECGKEIKGEIKDDVAELIKIQRRRSEKRK